MEGLPLELGTFVTGLQAIVQRSTNDARSSIDALPMDSILRGALEQFLKEQEAAKASAESSPRGLQIVNPETFEGSFDYERDDVLGYCTKADRASAVFVHPLAVVRGGRPLLLVDEMTRQIFPETGDLLAFSGPGRPRQPRRGEVGVWRVAEHQTERATHYHLESEKRPVYEVRPVPFPSTEYDSVREFLREHGERAGGNILQPLLFQLGDGLIVGGRGERLDYTKDDTFESGLFAWNSLPALRLDGRLFVLGPLPKEQRVYECAGLAFTVRKLFKAHIGPGRAAGGVTKAQLREIVQSIDSVDTSLDALRVQRIRSELERLGEQQVAFDALVAELMNHPNVMHRIDQDITKEVTKQVEQKKDLQSDIARLLKERGEWEDRIRKQQTEHRKLREETSKIVRVAFEKACADEGVK